MAIEIQDAAGKKVTVVRDGKDGAPGAPGQDATINDMTQVTLIEGDNITIETDTTAKTIKISATGGGGGTTIVPIPEQQGTLTYNGQEQTPVWAHADLARYTISGEVAGTNAGVYHSIFTLTNPLDLWSDMTNTPKSIEWSINKAIATIPSTSSALTYNGNPQSPVWDDLIAGSCNKSGDLTGTDAGDYSTGFTPTSNYTWPDGTSTLQNISWSIVRAVTAVPTVVGTLTYNDSAQSPTLNGYDPDKMTMSGDTSKTNAGDYSVTFTPTANYKWPDGSVTAKSVDWSIAQAPGSLSIDKTSLSLTTASPTDEINVTRPGTGTISATSSNPAVADVSVSGNKVTVTGKEAGNVTITISVAADTNYTAPENKTCAVSSTVVSNQIIGVCWDYSNPSPELQRLTKANDPNGLVTHDITSEPVPAVGNGAGSSPFDNIYPWSKMDVWNVVNGSVTVKRGQSGFSFTSNDVVVFIPGYYYRIIHDTANKKLYYYISQKASSGFSKHPGSDRCVGKYNTGDGYTSKSGLAPLVNISRAIARTGHKSRGAKFNNYDFASWCAIQLLYLVEFANWDSQSKIGHGYVNGASAIIAGSCDPMTYHTGRPAGIDGQTGVMYRWIENPWGSVSDWVDGFNVNNRVAYICTNPANFADDTTTNYEATGITLPSSNWISGYGYDANHPWALIPSVATGSATTYACDYMYSYTGWLILKVGGSWYRASNAGLFNFNASMGSSSSGAGSDTGVRQLYLPTEAEIQKMAA